MAARKHKFRVGKSYKIVFWDHAHGIDNLVKCVVRGTCIDDNDMRVLISYWIVIESDEDVIQDNLEPTSIAKGLIISKKVIP
jgi:hypothetical protein